MCGVRSHEDHLLLSPPPSGGGRCPVGTEGGTPRSAVALREPPSACGISPHLAARGEGSSDPLSPRERVRVRALPSPRFIRGPARLRRRQIRSPALKSDPPRLTRGPEHPRRARHRRSGPRIKCGASEGDGSRPNPLSPRRRRGEMSRRDRGGHAEVRSGAEGAPLCLRHLPPPPGGGRGFLRSPLPEGEGEGEGPSPQLSPKQNARPRPRPAGPNRA